MGDFIVLMMTWLDETEGEKIASIHTLPPPSPLENFFFHMDLWRDEGMQQYVQLALQNKDGEIIQRREAGGFTW